MGHGRGLVWVMTHEKAAIRLGEVWPIMGHQRAGIMLGEVWHGPRES